MKANRLALILAAAVAVIASGCATSHPTYDTDPGDDSGEYTGGT